MAPLLSVVVATYNRPELLRGALASVEAQSWHDFECVVVDDASATASGVVSEFDERFRLVEHETNQGLAAAWNSGASQAKGWGLTFLDDDDEWTSSRLELAAKGLDRHPIAVCGGSILGDQKSTSRTRARMLEGDVHDRILDTFTPNMGRTAVRRDVFVPFDVRFRASQDVEWWIRQSRSATATSTSEVGHLYRIHQGQRVGNGTIARVEASRLMLSEHAGYFSVHPRARAFRQYRVGYMLAQLGDRNEAVRWLLRSLRTRPTRPAGAALVRTVAGARSNRSVK